jgi:hypothetical protein
LHNREYLSQKKEYRSYKRARRALLTAIIFNFIILYPIKFLYTYKLT